MAEKILDVSPRKRSGSSGSRATRREGRVPSVIYSNGDEAMSIAVSARDFTQAASKSLPSQVFLLKSDDSEFGERRALVKDIQKDPLSGQVLHIDFQEVKAGQSVRLHVLLDVQGQAPGVKDQGGVLSVAGRELLIEALPKDIPDRIFVDISELKLGQSILAKDLSLPEGVGLAENPERTIVSVISGRQAKLAASAGSADLEEGAGEEGEGSSEGESESSGESEEKSSSDS